MEGEEKIVAVTDTLGETVMSKLEGLKGLELGSEEHSRATEDVAKLARIYMDDRKAVEDRLVNLNIKQAQIDAERDIKTDEILERKSSRWVDWAIKGAEIVITAAVTVGCVKLNNKIFRETWTEGLQFESGNTWGGGLTKSLSNKVTNFLGKKG